MEDKEPVDKKICKSCGASKSFRDFVKCKTCQGGYTPRCRHCVASYNKIVYDYNRRKNKKSDDNLSMFGVGKDTYIEMYQFFEKIGYDLTRPIAEQFAEKHNLKVKKRNAHKLNKYDPKSLGLI